MDPGNSLPLLCVIRGRLGYHRDESTWKIAIRDILNQIFAETLDWEVRQARFGITLDGLNFNDTPFFVVELKNEAGIDGDASLQAAISYAHIATSPVAKVKWFHVLCLCFNWRGL